MCVCVCVCVAEITDECNQHNLCAIHQFGIILTGSFTECHLSGMSFIVVVLIVVIAFVMLLLVVVVV